MSIVEQLLPLERDIFLWMNEHHTHFWDVFMYTYSAKLTWLPLAILTAFALLYKKNWKDALLLVLCITLVGVLCDQLSASFIKPFFERLRPSHHPDFKDLVYIVNGYRGGQFGFISAHAANGFGIALFTILLFRNRIYSVVCLTWVLTTAYSRIYLGVHFITDILGGIILGSFVGILMYIVYILTRGWVLKIPSTQVRRPRVSWIRVHLVTASTLLSIIIITIFAFITSA